MIGLTGKICITGASGSLGTAFIQRATQENWDCSLRGFARNEMKINQTKAKFSHVDFRVGDIQDIDFLRTAFLDCDYVLHTAAQKVVPLCESNPRNSILTNVMGTMAVCQAAVECGVKQVVTTFTDKQVKPTTTYGLSKGLACAITREANTWGDSQFNAVRYGNVIGSASSIKPKLEELKAKGLPFTITDARCTRFWLTMDAALDLILLAFSQTEAGTIVVPKAYASPVINLFRAVDPDWPIVDIGIRPGEKLNELLLDDVEVRHTVDMGDYFLVYPPDSNIISNLPDGYEYSSNNPIHILTVEELKRMI